MDPSINPALLHLGTQHQNQDNPYLDADYLTDMSLVGDNNGAGEISIEIHPADDDDDILDDHFTTAHGNGNGNGHSGVVGVAGLGSPPYSAGFGGDESYGGNAFDNYGAVPMSTEDFGFTELTMNTPPMHTDPLPSLDAQSPTSPLLFTQGAGTSSDYGSPQQPSTPASPAFLMGATNPATAADILGHSLDGGAYFGPPMGGMSSRSHSPMQQQYIEGLGFLPSPALGQLNTSGPYFHPSSNPSSSVHSHSPSGSVDYSSSSHGRVSPVHSPPHISPSLTSPSWATFNTNTPQNSLLTVPGRSGHARRHSSSEVPYHGSSPGSSTMSLPYALAPQRSSNNQLGHTRGGHSLDMQSDGGGHLMRPDLIPLPISTPSSLLASPFLDDDLPLPPEINPADLNFNQGGYTPQGYEQGYGEEGYRRSHVRRHSGSGYTHNISGRGRSPIRGGVGHRHQPYPSPSHSPTPSFREYNTGPGPGFGENGFDPGNASYELDPSLSLGGGPNRSRAPSASGSAYGGGGRHSRAPSASGSNYGAGGSGSNYGASGSGSNYGGRGGGGHSRGASGGHNRTSSVGHGGGRRSRSASRVAGGGDEGVGGGEGDEDRDGPIIKETITTDATHAAALSRRKSNGKEQKLFQCRVCGQEMTAKHNLKRHEDAHYGIKAFQCSWCDRALTTNADLKRHQKTCKKNPDLVGQPPPPLNIVHTHGSGGVGSPPLGVGSPPLGVGSPPLGVRGSSPYSAGVGSSPGASPFSGVGSPGGNSLGAPSPADSYYGASSPGGTSYGAPSPGSVNDEGGSPVPS